MVNNFGDHAHDEPKVAHSVHDHIDKRPLSADEELIFKLDLEHVDEAESITKVVLLVLVKGSIR